MKALVKRYPKIGLWLEDIEHPQYGPYDVLIKIKKTAICGTDLHIYNWDAWAERTIPLPLNVGHEFVGTVIAIGEQVTHLKVGDRVSGEGHLTCGHCRCCRSGKQHLCANTLGVGVQRAGAFADCLALPESNVYLLPSDISDDMAAILDPLGNAVHTALAFDLVGESVLITGAGPIGMMAVAIARKVGAHTIVITDVNDYRLELAKSMGATRTVNVAKEELATVRKSLGIEEGFSVGLEMSGNPTAISQMLEHLAPAANVALLGLSSAPVALDWHQIIFKGITLKGIYGREMFETWHKMIKLLQSGLNVQPVISHHFKAEEFEQGFELMNQGQAAKVILEW